MILAKERIIIITRLANKYPEVVRHNPVLLDCTSVLDLNHMIVLNSEPIKRFGNAEMMTTLTSLINMLGPNHSSSVCYVIKHICMYVCMY